MKAFRLIVGLVIVGVVIATVYFIKVKTAGEQIPFKEDRFYEVVQVLDGDTFTVRVGENMQEITVRMLGINTPETVDPRKPPECFGKEASNETKTLLSGKKVRLVLNPKREVKDKYGRYLAYVYKDGVFVNEYLIQKGFAREYTYGTPYSLQKDFRKLETKARKDKRGLWAKC